MVCYVPLPLHSFPPRRLLLTAFACMFASFCRRVSLHSNIQHSCTHVVIPGVTAFLFVFNATCCYVHTSTSAPRDTEFRHVITLIGVLCTTQWLDIFHRLVSLHLYIYHIRCSFHSHCRCMYAAHLDIIRHHVSLDVYTASRHYSPPRVAACIHRISTLLATTCRCMYTPHLDIIGHHVSLHVYTASRHYWPPRVAACIHRISTLLATTCRCMYTPHLDIIGHHVSLHVYTASRHYWPPRVAACIHRISTLLATTCRRS